MSKSIELKPDWKRSFWGYLLGIILIPVFGIGLAVLWVVHTKRVSTVYTVTDRHIEYVDKNISQKIDLANVSTLDVEQNWLDKKFNLGDLKLSSTDRSITLRGQENPQKLSEMIETAIRAERKRIEDLNKKDTKPKEPESNPGTLDKLDYLTGLWHQGLLSDEDYEKERKHFES